MMKYLRYYAFVAFALTWLLSGGAARANWQLQSVSVDLVIINDPGMVDGGDDFWSHTSGSVVATTTLATLTAEAEIEYDAEFTFVGGGTAPSPNFTGSWGLSVYCGVYSDSVSATSDATFDDTHGGTEIGTLETEDSTPGSYTWTQDSGTVLFILDSLAEYGDAQAGTTGSVAANN
jgi:hypothetical protein